MNYHIPLLLLLSIRVFFLNLHGQNELDSFGAQEVENNLQQERIWTSVKGSKLQASLLNIEKDKIIVLSQGKELKIPISNLSKQDRILLDQFQIENSSPSEIDFSLYRFWTNTSGKVVEAKIHEASASSVQIQVKGEKLFRLSINSLVDNDKSYIKKFIQQKNTLSDDQILKRMTMYKWRDTPSGRWTYRLEFRTKETAENWREVEWIWFAGGSRSGSWKLEPNGVIKSTFGDWQFPLSSSSKQKVLKGKERYGRSSDYPTLYGSTGFD